MAHEELIEWLRKRIAELEDELSKMKGILLVLENRQVAAIPAEAITEEDLAALPWKGYQSGKGEWIFADQAPKPLVARLEREGQVQVGGYVYSLREGSMGKRFISRRPLTQRGQKKKGMSPTPVDLERLSRSR